jgi:two-component system sensor histidine kinase PilS (NtrC family)
MSTTSSLALPTGIDAAHRRELYFFTLYRVLQSALLMLAAFGPLERVVSLHQPPLAKTLAVVYLLLSLGLLLMGRRSRLPLPVQVGMALAIDITVALLAKYALGGVELAVSLLLLVNIGAAAVILSLHSGMAFAIAAAAGTIGEFVHSQLGPWAGERSLTAAVMYSVTYLAIALLCHLLGRQMRESAELADQRGAELAGLSQLNELIIRRMRTGVLVCDVLGRIRLMNEAAWMLLGEPKPEQRELEQLSPGLHQRWKRWRNDQQQDTGPLALVPDRPLVSPHFAKLTLADELFVAFLDDSALVSRRAEELTLSTLGRLSASIAHEIRNPLAAIHHAAQLLEESKDLPPTDQRLVEIIVNHCGRMNDIVENVLALSRRERSRPESIELAHWVQRFVEEFKTSHFIEGNALLSIAGQRPLHAVVDPRQLHQVLSALVQNALTYGRLPEQTARIAISARQLGEGGAPVVEVIDRGPGVPAAVAAHIFDPFYTTSEFGSGLGLYIARQLCEANQARLDYVSVAGGGSCFRITLARAQPLRTPMARDAGARTSPA